MRKVYGFTLIELVAVIVVLGILAIVAIPQFTSLRTDAASAAAQGVGGSLSSASSLNFAVRSANSANGSAVTTCTAIATLLAGGALPVGYSAVLGTASATSTANDGEVGFCTITNSAVSGSSAATFSVVLKN